MKKTSILAITLLPSLLLLSFVMIENNVTGLAVTDMEIPEGGIPSYGPSAEDRVCMMTCASTGCTPGDMDCMMAKQAECSVKCNVQKPEQTEEESCVETCAMKGCDRFDFDCQSKNQAKCDEECGMVQEPEAKSEEEICIRECVRFIDPTIRCSGGEGGETGNEICQKCAAECVHFYAGPCLGEEKLEERKQACVTCEHCYGEPVMGDSGEGYDCTVDVVCKDASGEFGDNPGTGEGIVSRTTERIGNVFSRVGNFFRGLFGIGEEETPGEVVESPVAEEAPQEETRSEAPAEISAPESA